jgi:hypothetical protein
VGLQSADSAVHSQALKTLIRIYTALTAWVDMASVPQGERPLESENSLTVTQLYRELVQSRSTEPTGPGPCPHHRTEQLLMDVVDQLFTEDHFRFDEEFVKGNLDEILVLLVALRDGETHGKGLMEDLAFLFDSRLSPGTVYPRLHNLESDGVLEMQELVRTKEYHVDDGNEARRMVERAMQQHLVLGFLFYSALNEL